MQGTACRCCPASIRVAARVRRGGARTRRIPSRWEPRAAWLHLQALHSWLHRGGEEGRREKKRSAGWGSAPTAPGPPAPAAAGCARRRRAARQGRRERRRRQGGAVRAGEARGCAAARACAGHARRAAPARQCAHVERTPAPPSNASICLPPPSPPCTPLADCQGHAGCGGGAARVQVTQAGQRRRGGAVCLELWRDRELRGRRGGRRRRRRRGCYGRAAPCSAPVYTMPACTLERGLPA